MYGSTVNIFCLNFRVKNLLKVAIFEGGLKLLLLTVIGIKNTIRFPIDFIFKLTETEKKEVVTNSDHLKLLKYSPQIPYAFTEYGALMLTNKNLCF